MFKAREDDLTTEVEMDYLVKQVTEIFHEGANKLQAFKTKGSRSKKTTKSKAWLIRHVGMPG